MNYEVRRIEREWDIYAEYYTEEQLKGFLKERKEERDFWKEELENCEEKK